MSEEAQVAIPGESVAKGPIGFERRSRFHSILIVAAVIFAAATIFYSFAWMYYIRLRPRVEFGIDVKILPDSTAKVTSLYPDGPAEKAGLKVGDRILAINGQSVRADPRLFAAIREMGRPGDIIPLTIERSGRPEPMQVQVVVRPNSDLASSSRVKRTALQILGSYPLFFLVVGLAVLFMRIDNGNACLRCCSSGSAHVHIGA